MIKNYKVDISEAIRAIDLDSSFIINGEVTNEEEYNNNVQFSSTPISWSDASSKQTELQTDYDNKKYQRDRAKEYPSIVDQLDDIYHNGIDGWKATIKTTKDKYPKE
jgi:hypothetical protein